MRGEKDSERYKRVIGVKGIGVDLALWSFLYLQSSWTRLRICIQIFPTSGTRFDCPGHYGLGDN